MKNYKVVLITTSVIAIASVGYFLYQKKKNNEINEKVTSLEDAIKKLESIKGK
jgi:cell division protein FtsL